LQVLWHKGPRRLPLDPRAEDGIALVLALAILAFFSATTATAVYMVTSAQGTSSRSASQQSAEALAEAGINDALAVLNGQLDSSGAVVDGGVSPLTPTLLPSTTVGYPSLGGSVTYSGTIDANDVWTIVSTGQVAGNPVQQRTLTQKATVVGLTNGASESAWSRFYQDSTASCLTVDDETFVTNVGTRGDLCLVNGGHIDGASSNVDVGGNVYVDPPATDPPGSASGWTSSSNVKVADSVYATNSIAAAATGSTLKTTGYGFSIPGNATIDGISVSVQRLASACCNAVQTISTAGSPTGGSFTVHGTPPGGSQGTSGSIARNASSSSVTTALNLIYGAGNVSCSGGPLPTGVGCTFQGADADMAVTLMSLGTNGLTGGSSSHPVFANTTTGSSSALQDSSVKLLKNNSAVGTDHAASTPWGSIESTATYGGSADLWGTTWTPADVNGSTFGVQLTAKNVAAAAATAAVDFVQITVTYSAASPSSIGTASTSVAQANVGGTCTYASSAPHAPCGSADKVYASSSTTTAAADNPALEMPQVDFNYWYQNAKPGPKHFCTNPNPGITSTFFDNDTTLNGSLTINGEMAGNTQSGTNWSYDTNTPNIDYDCQVWSQPPTGGTLLGEIAWNHTTHVLTIAGTVFIDGSFRFDNDGQVIHYFGRGDLMSSKEDEIDSVVCAGGTGTTLATSCLSNMSSWDSSQNEMVLMSDTAASWNSHDSDDYDEYDQGSSTCSGNTPPTCYNGHLPGAFQGILYSTGECLIHQNFQDSGPVICNSISIPDENGINPTYYTFPSIGNLTDGQKFASTPTASNFEIDLGSQTG
jgi:hypothetical protein